MERKTTVEAEARDDLDRLRAAITENRIEEALALAKDLRDRPQIPANTKVSVNYLLGMALAKGGRYSEATAVLREVVRAVPNSVEAIVNLAGILLNQRRDLEALMVLEDCRQAGGSGPELDKLQGVALSRLRNPLLRRLLEIVHSTAPFLFGAWTLLTGIFAWPLLLRTPRTVARLLAVFAGRQPASDGVKDGPLAGFTESDAWYRPYYRRLARTLRIHGRFGYAFEWCFGLVLGDLYFINGLAYRLYARLGDRASTAIGLLLATAIPLALAGIGLAGGGSAAVVWLAVYLWVLAGSPALGIDYLDFGKPEYFWWPFAAILGFLLFTGQFPAAGLLWSGLVVFSLPVAVLSAALLGPAVLAQMLAAGGAEILLPEIGSFLAGAIPGLGLILGRVGMSLHLKDVSGGIMSGQKFREAKNLAAQINDELPFLLPLPLCLLVAGLEGLPLLPFAVLAATAAALYLINQRHWKINDPAAFDLAAFATFWSLAAACGGPWTLLATLTMLLRPRTSYLGHPAEGGLLPLLGGTPWRQIDWVAACESSQRQLAYFPLAYFRDIRAPLMPSADAMAEAMPPHSRLMVETDGHMRFENPALRAFNTILWESLSKHAQELVNDDHAVTTAADLIDYPLSCINAGRMSGAEIAGICQRLGVRFLLVRTPATQEAMLREGWSIAAVLQLGERDHLRVLNLPPRTRFVLLRAPADNPDYDVIPGAGELKYSPNRIAWTAKAGQAYTIRYRYHRYFRATQNGRHLPIEAVKPFEGKGLTFMRVAAPADGPIELRFRIPFLTQ